MGRLAEIYEGWKNFTFQNSKVEAEAKRRMEICINGGCGKLSANNYCALCGCYMPAKVRSPKSRCRIRRW
jgi:hypothetical protein